MTGYIRKAKVPSTRLEPESSNNRENYTKNSVNIKAYGAIMWVSKGGFCYKMAWKTSWTKPWMTEIWRKECLQTMGKVRGCTVKDSVMNGLGCFGFQRTKKNSLLDFKEIMSSNLFQNQSLWSLNYTVTEYCANQSLSLKFQRKRRIGKPSCRCISKYISNNCDVKI